MLRSDARVEGYNIRWKVLTRLEDVETTIEEEEEEEEIRKKRDRGRSEG
jgi:hypothetical protein